MRLTCSFAFAFCFLVLQCQSTEIQEEAFVGKNSGKYLPRSAKSVPPFLAETEALFRNIAPYQGEFQMTLQTLTPQKQTFPMEGKIWVNTDSSKLKIQLMDNYFGMVFSEVLANREKIKIRTSGNPKVIEEPMGDLVLLDPNTQKKISLPFPVIFQYLTGDFRKEFDAPIARYLPEEKRILLEKSDGSYEYFFSPQGLSRVELLSPKRGLKALSLVQENFPAGSIPPKQILTQVVSLTTEKETASVLLKMKKLTKTQIPDSVFGWE